ncbi:MAG: response regulator [Desulforhabdus sp.]|jgi:two-component system cell cycle response regulator DivK|nr:response regulator [Desulforhabdus sp.]
MNTKKKPRILVVEDNPANLELFLDILEIGGYESFHTSQGGEAIEIAAREVPDLILLDIQLPGMDGLAVVKALRSMRATKDIKTIALTAYAMKGDREMFLEKGFDGYIAKPVAVQGFLQTIEGYLQPQETASSAQME